jgi:hypothetical protein
LEQIWLTAAGDRGGGYKVVALLSLLLANSDDKHGYTTEWNTFLAAKQMDFKLAPCSLSRYFAHEHNAGPILALKPLILEFLESKKEMKSSGEYNNLENNSVNGLQDLKTIAELKAMCILDNIILKPFLKKVNQYKCISLTCIGERRSKINI